ncbi:uncharacterized protein JCM6883_006623 [Sporobolomyces salmoneus]|uniref:uncharacterized protein n=1 Tax=Sporobolomyces salmoneus TaxID=183962 RepID=UPI00317B04A9
MSTFENENRPIKEYTASSKFDDLPPELLAKVFKSIPYYPSDARRRTLASLCRVSRYFNEVGRPILYSSLHFRLASKDGHPSPMVITLTERPDCAKHVKSLRVSSKNAKPVDYFILKWTLSHLHLDVLKVSGSGYVERIVIDIITHQPRLKKLVLPDAELKEDSFGRLFPALPRLEVFKGRVRVSEILHAAESEEAGEEEQRQLDALRIPPAFRLKELYFGSAPRQNAFDYAVQSSLTTLRHLTLSMNDWRVTKDLSRLVSLESLVIVANSNHGAVFDISTGCLPALKICIKSLEQLGLRTISFHGSLKWANSVSSANDLFESLPTSLEELGIGVTNAEDFTTDSLRPHLKRLPNLRRLVLAIPGLLPSSVSLGKRTLDIVRCASSSLRRNHFLDSATQDLELDPFGTGSEIDSDGEGEDEEQLYTDGDSSAPGQVDHDDEDSDENGEWNHEDEDPLVYSF